MFKLVSTGAYLASLRRAAGRSLQQVAELTAERGPARVPKGTLASFESRGRPLSLAQLGALSRAYVVPLPHIMEFVEIDLRATDRIGLAASPQDAREAGMVALRERRFADAVDWFRESLRLSRALGRRLDEEERSCETLAMLNAAIALNALGLSIPAEDYLWRVIRGIRTPPTFRAQALYVLAGFYLERGEPSLARAVGQRSRELSRSWTDEGRRLFSTQLSCLEAACIESEGRHGEAAERYRPLVDELDAHGDTEGADSTRCNLARCLVESGQVDEGLELYRAAEGRLEARGSEVALCRLRIHLARSLLLLDRRDQADTALDSALDLSRRLGNDSLEFHVLYEQRRSSELAGAAGDVQRLKARLRKLLPYQQHETEVVRAFRNELGDG